VGIHDQIKVSQVFVFVTRSNSEHRINVAHYKGDDERWRFNKKLKSVRTKKKKLLTEKQFLYKYTKDFMFSKRIFAL
jgi:hypothetical protein